MVNLDAREARMLRMAHELQESGIEVPGLISHTTDIDKPQVVPPEHYYHIAGSQKNIVDLRVWQAEHPHDPAVQVCAAHILYNSLQLTIHKSLLFSCSRNIYAKSSQSLILNHSTTIFPSSFSMITCMNMLLLA